MTIKHKKNNLNRIKNRNAKWISKNASSIAIIRLINKYFWKSGIGPIGILLYNLVFIGTLSFLYRDSGTIAVASLVTLPILTIGINFMPLLIIDLKRTTFMQKILLTNSDRKNLFLPLIFFGPVIFVAYFFFLSIVVAINYDQLERVFGNINWFQLIFSLLLTIFLSLFIGQMIFSHFKNLVLTQSIAMILTLAITLFSGMLIPVTILNGVPFLKYTSYINPFKFTNNLIINSWFATKNPFNLEGGGIFNFATDFNSLAVEIKNGVIGTKKILIFSKVEKIFNIIIPLLYILIIFSLNVNKKISLEFRKTRRNHGVNWIKKYK